MQKSIGELIDELIIAHIKLYHVIEEKHRMAEIKKLRASGELGIEEDQLNGHRSALRNAINEYFNDPQRDIKVGEIKKYQK